jgi:hypothetical protein
VVDCHVDLQNWCEIEDVDALRLLDGTKGFMNTAKLLGKIATATILPFVCPALALHCRMSFGYCYVAPLERRIKHR